MEQTLLKIGLAVAVIAIAVLPLIFGSFFGKVGTVLAVGCAFVVAFLILRSDINVEGLWNQVTENMPSPPQGLIRDENSLYLDGKPIGRVEGVQIDENAGRVRFARLESQLSVLEFQGKRFAFRRFQLGGNINAESQTGVRPPYDVREISFSILSKE